MTALLRTSKFNISPKNRLAKILHIFEAKMQNRKIYNQVVFELENLSGRELADLGIARADIYSIAREASKTH